MENEQGFSLLEVIASILLIAIILLSFFHFFIQTNKTAVSNNEKLVVINLADAELERLKLDPFTETLSKPGSHSYKEFVTKTVHMNDRDYKIQIDATQNAEERSFKLINVIVEVVSENGKIKSSVEGYVSYE